MGAYALREAEVPPAHVVVLATPGVTTLGGTAGARHPGRGGAPSSLPPIIIIITHLLQAAGLLVQPEPRGGGGGPEEGILGTQFRKPLGSLPLS